VSCGEKKVDVGTIETAIAQTEAAKPTNTFTPEPSSTFTPEPTFTIKPSATNTVQPTATEIVEEPIHLSGTGDAVVDIEKWLGAGIAKITYSGSSNFIVENYDKDNKRIDLLVNEIGTYEGTVPIDFFDSEQTSRFVITSSGDWEIDVLSIQSARLILSAGPVIGQGDDVFFFIGYDDIPDILEIDASKAESNFIVYGFGNRRDLLVNVIAPYSGTILIDNDLIGPDNLLIFVVTATGKWTIDIYVK
jgi:hypothetical protein